ncbi:MAG TPA: DUF748 domain-containing protein [Micropepsaceae bacterium]|nr:DUF748 domain-containing protein [Micropepsaceae bacterium]
MRQDLKRQVAIAKLTFDPFTFTAEITGFALREADGAPIVSFDFLRVDAQLSSLVNGAWTFKEVRLDRPNFQVLLNADGTLNLAKLAPPAPASQTPLPPSAVPAIRIETLAVHAGRIGIEDRTRAKPFATTLTPIEFTLTNFRTAPNFQNAYTFAASTVAGERLTWSGQFSVQPLGSAGRFTIADLKAATIAAYLQDTLPFDLPSGALDLEGEYRVALGDKFGLTVDLPTLKLRDVVLVPKGVTGAPWISLPSVEISRTRVSLADHKLAVERIQSDNAKLSVWRESDGSLNLMQLFGARTPAGATAPAPVATAPAAPAVAPSWNLGVGTVDIRGASIEAEDRMVQPAVKMSLAPVALTVSGYSSDPGSTLKLDANLTVGSKGQVAAQGDVKLTPMEANFAIGVDDFELPPLQPYIAASTAMELTGGQFSTKGKFHYMAEPAKGTPGVQFSGDVTLANLATTDAASHQDFIKWQALRIIGIDYRQAPDHLDIARIEALKPYGRVIVTADQTLNVVAIINPPGRVSNVAKTEAGSPKADGNAAKTPASDSTMSMRIGAVRITDGSANFADYSVQPNFAAGMLALNGTVTGLSSDANSRAEVKITGNVDRYAPVDISGTVNLLSAAVFTDIAMNFRNMELTTFNPYSGKYAGYNISKGKLTTELRYKVENRKLDAQHHIVLDQLEFGAATDSKVAVPLPVRLAVSLLKDRDGIIDLNLPVTGSLDDPQFRVGPIIWQAFVGLLTKIVTAPFALLGSLFNGGEELAYVDFHAGSAALLPDQQEKIVKLSKALAERPQLRLDIPLQTLAPADDAALAQTAFENAVTPLLPVGDTPATPQQRLTALTLLYQQQMGVAPSLPVPAAPEADSTPAGIAFLETELRPRFSATQAQRDLLARARADAVQAAVLSNTDINSERVFLSERTSGKDSAADAARMELDLQ